MRRRRPGRERRGRRAGCRPRGPGTSMTLCSRSRSRILLFLLDVIVLKSRSMASMRRLRRLRSGIGFFSAIMVKGRSTTRSSTSAQRRPAETPDAGTVIQKDQEIQERRIEIIVPICLHSLLLVISFQDGPPDLAVAALSSECLPIRSSLMKSMETVPRNMMRKRPGDHAETIALGHEAPMADAAAKPKPTELLDLHSVLSLYLSMCRVKIASQWARRGRTRCR